MSKPAADVYRVDLDYTSVPKPVVRRALAWAMNVLAMGASDDLPGGVVITVLRIDTGEELFRHVEDVGDDDDHLADAIQRDLVTLPATEFASRWLG